MLSVAQELIDRITAVIYYLRVGKPVAPIEIPEDLPENEIRQLITYVNRFLVEFAGFSEALDQIAQGELVPAVAGKMAVVQSLKTLHSNLRHLTWKTQQVAAGDLEQKVDFMGDFSAAFNSMTKQLKDSREQLLKLNAQLETRNRFIRETFGRYTSDDIVQVLLDMPEGLKLGGEKRRADHPHDRSAGLYRHGGTSGADRRRGPVEPLSFGHDRDHPAKRRHHR